ncbi:hypothetical protein [Roseospira goensis]|uniref:Uncharacterized protein n=1 Tax=Roseospira goensis TaxID=391922 RepID=A0A7W6S358_9PROT|nr:hypothetical protein [Roseospira goensis]MBB4287319.1 hypothetical protein [Roseospira goensis]
MPLCRRLDAPLREKPSMTLRARLARELDPALRAALDEAGGDDPA